MTTPVSVPCGLLQLEGVLDLPADCRDGAVVCHPHPQYGGDMDNPIVLAVTVALRGASWASLRFNFRGVGASTGAWGGGVDEADDVRAAITWLCEQAGLPTVFLAGYSFGAALALQVGADSAAVAGMAAIAPPLALYDLAGLTQCRKAKLFVVGDRDPFCPVTELRRRFAEVAEPKALHVVSGADHFFAARESTVGSAVQVFASSSTS